MLGLTNNQLYVVLIIALLFYFMVIRPSTEEKPVPSPSPSPAPVSEGFFQPSLNATNKAHGEEGTTWSPYGDAKKNNPNAAKCSKQCCVAGTWPTPFSILSPDEKMLEPGTFIPSNESCYGYGSSGCVCLDPEVYDWASGTPNVIKAGNYYADGYQMIDPDVNVNMNGEEVEAVQFGSFGRCDLQNTHMSTIKDKRAVAATDGSGRAVTSAVNFPATTPTYGDIVTSAMTTPTAQTSSAQ